MATRAAGTAIGTLVVAAFGLGLVWLAAPRTIGHTILALDRPVMETLAQDGAVPPARALAAIATRKRALAWIDFADGWDDIGALYLMLARRPGMEGRARDALLDRSTRATAHGLALSPARPFAWLQLAQARRARTPAAPAGFVKALRLSYLTAPMEPAIVSQRVRLGFAARAVLPEGAANRIADDVRLWAAHDPKTLAEWARPQFALPWVRAALSGKDQLESAFLSAYLRLPAR